MGQRASKFLGSAVPVEVEVRAPSDSKDARDTDELGITAVPGKGQAGIRPSPLK